MPGTSSEDIGKRKTRRILMLSAFARIFEITECTTQIELAEMLNIRQSSISDAKRRGAIPPDWQVKLLRLKGVNPDWILTGEGAKYLGPIESERAEPITIYKVKIRPPEECTAQELVNELVRRALNHIG